MMHDETRGDSDRLDLAPLDPRADTAHFDRLVRDVRTAATPELVRRQTGLTLWGQLTRWRRPVFAISGLLALTSGVILAVVRPPTTRQSTLAEAFGVPSQVAHWVQANDKPTPGDLLGLKRSER